MICHICGCKLAESEKGLEAHMKRFHAVQVLSKPKSRPKADVVADWEKRNSHMVVDPTKMPCLDGCRCNSCFQTALDRLVAKSEESANDSGTDSGVNDVVASDELQERPTTNGQYTIQHGYGSQD